MKREELGEVHYPVLLFIVKKCAGEKFNFSGFSTAAFAAGHVIIEVKLCCRNLVFVIVIHELQKK